MSDTRELPNVGPKGVFKGNVAIVTDHGSFPGCLAIEFAEKWGGPPVAEQLNTYFTDNPGSTLVHLSPYKSGSVLAIIAPFLSTQEMEDVREFGELVREEQEKRRAARAAQEAEASAKLEAENAKIKKEYDDAQYKLKELALQGERCVKNHKKAMPVEEAEAAAVLRERQRILAAMEQEYLIHPDYTEATKAIIQGLK